MFDYFWDCKETIGDAAGMPLYSIAHICEILLCIAFTAWISLYYRKASTEKKNKVKKIFAIAVIADELFKHIGLLAFGNWNPDYLPLHLCSINIFLVVIYCITNNKTIGNFLWAFCVPAAFIAILFPTWHLLPVVNFMHLHSFTIHVLLFSFPIMLVVSGEVKRDYRQFPKEIGILAILAVIDYFINLKLGTNFMFLMRAEAGTPLVLFEKWFGNHLIGCLIAVPIVVLAMYIPFKKPENQ